MKWNVCVQTHGGARKFGGFPVDYGASDAVSAWNETEEDDTGERDRVRED